MKILFVLYGPFDCNSAIQALHFGNELTGLGCEVTLCATTDPAEIHNVGEPQFECIRYRDLPRVRRDLEARRGDALVCAWTPRERVRRAVLPLVEELGIPYVVHLEDNEEYLLASALHMPIGELQRTAVRARDRPDNWDLVTIPEYREFLKRAAAVTMITEELNEFNFGDRPHHLMRPGIDAERFRPDLEPPQPRHLLGLHEEDFVLVYHGTMHYANQHEMLSLYLAVKLLQRRGLGVKLVRLGFTNLGGVDPRTFGALRDGVVELGLVPWHQTPGYLALADAFVQPGAPDDFNRYRLPSKLPEFLAMGRPVVLPHCNIGNDLTAGENVLLLEDGTGPEIADRVADLAADAALADRLGRGAREFALQNLSWHDNAVSLLDFYREVVAEHGLRRPTGFGARLES
jgi:glycosyltransferase involved in cell wall biosynthesis